MILQLPAWGRQPFNNLAAQARITADSEYSADYRAQFAADGVAQAAGAHNDPRHAWCVNGATHKQGATLRLEWPAPVTIAELVLYGRCAWFADEFWRDYEILTADPQNPILKGQLKNQAGPQRIALPQPFQTRSLAIRFSHPFGGLNPGLAELLVLAAPATDEQIAAAVRIEKAGRAAPSPGFARDEQRNKALETRPQSQSLKRGLLAGALGFRSLVVIQRRPLNPTHVYTYHQEGFAPGGGLFVFTPGEVAQASSLHGAKAGKMPALLSGLKELVASPQGQILDYDVSFDGREILFSWRKSEAAVYQLFTIHADGTGLRQLTGEGDGHNFNASWLPDGGIVFLSTRRPAFAYCWTSPVGILHRMDRDGSNVVRISANYLNDFTPTVAGDGRIMYGRWEYVDRPAIPIQSLWTINPDGTGLAHYFGNRVLSPATFIEARTVPGGSRALCTMTAHNGPCRGAIGLVDPAYGDNAQAAIRNLTPDIEIGKVGEGNGNSIRGPYENPYPLDASLYLVSREGTIQLRDLGNTRLVTVLAPRDALGFYSPQPLRPRKRPPVIATPLRQIAAAANLATTATTRPLATVILQDVYQGLEPWVRRGEVRQIAVVQEIEKSRLADVKYRSFGFQFPVVSCGATYAPKKVWGYAPVAADGSACFQVPAGVPIYFMALDAQGRAVQRMRSFTHLMPGEARGCVGCHEPRRMTPRAEFGVRASARTLRPSPLVPPEWGLTGFSYNRIVQPVLDAHCVACHSGANPPRGLDLGGDLTDFFNVSYEHLARLGTLAMDPDAGGGTMRQFGGNPYTKWIPSYNGMEESIPQITPKTWGSPVSRLADLVLAGHPDADGKPRVSLSDAERRRILAWIDLNVPYYGTSSSNYLNNQGCRRQYPAELDRVLDEVASRRCAQCHKADGADGEAKLPRAFWVRLTHPELNNFLTAPLAREAGGSGKCARAVFASTADPDYQAILQTFQPVLAALARLPREDMP